MKQPKPKPRSVIRQAANSRSGAGAHKDKRRSKKAQQRIKMIWMNFHD